MCEEQKNFRIHDFRKCSHSNLLYSKLLLLAVFRSDSVLFSAALQSNSDSYLHCAILVHVYSNFFLSSLHEFYLGTRKFHLGTGPGMPRCTCSYAAARLAWFPGPRGTRLLPTIIDV